MPHGLDPATSNRNTRLIHAMRPYHKPHRAFGLWWDNATENIAYAETLKLDSLRELGAALKVLPKATVAAGIGPIAVPSEYRNAQPPTLSDLGIDKRNSALAQKPAALPEATYNVIKASQIVVANSTRPLRTRTRCRINRRRREEGRA